MTPATVSIEQSAMKFSIRKAEGGQAFLVASGVSPVYPEEAARTSYELIAGALHDHGLEIVHERIFGSLGAEGAVMTARRRSMREKGIQADGPVAYIEGRAPCGEGLAGVIIHAVPAGSSWTIMDGDEPCGRGWQAEGTTFLVLQGLTSGVHRNQTRRVFERAERILKGLGFSYRNVARTWFYLSNILDWYPEFNKTRSEKYGEFGIMPGPRDRDLLLPASTGISGSMTSGSSCSMDLLAVSGPEERVFARHLSNDGQLDAFRYGSAFSRGALIELPGASLLQISGTAAIDEKGRSLFAGDIRGQITCTLGKVESLMTQAGAGLHDIAAATVFVKRPEYAEVFWEMATARGLGGLPAVCVVADVCRDELLFEMDAEALINPR